MYNFLICTFNQAKKHLMIGSDFVLQTYGITKEPQSQSYMIVMQFCENGDLGQNLPFLNKYSDIFQIIYQVACGLHEIHTYGFCHKDLHIGNILLDNNRTSVYISDLGLCGPNNED